MNSNRSLSRRWSGSLIVMSLVIAGSVFGVVAYAPHVSAKPGSVPIEIDPIPNVVAGNQLTCNVVLSSASNITVSSSPAGYVSYSGYAPANATIRANTSVNASGPVTVYLTTDGSTVKTASTYILPSQ